MPVKRGKCKKNTVLSANASVDQRIFLNTLSPSPPLMRKIRETSKKSAVTLQDAEKMLRDKTLRLGAAGRTELEYLIRLHLYIENGSITFRRENIPQTVCEVVNWRTENYNLKFQYFERQQAKSRAIQAMSKLELRKAFYARHQKGIPLEEIDRFWGWEEKTASGLLDDFYKMIDLTLIGAYARRKARVQRIPLDACPLESLYLPVEADALFRGLLTEKTVGEARRLFVNPDLPKELAPWSKRFQKAVDELKSWLK